ncbi:MAG: histidine kinase N-terminal 7TM domain-containing protein, partial [Candidatus Paceibacterota bacterium]
MEYFAISAIINAITSTVLGTVIFLRNPRDQISIFFSLFAAFVAGWSISYFFWQIAENASSALFWTRMLMSFAIFIPFIFFDFVARFLTVRKRLRTLIVGGYVVGLVFLSISWTPYFISGVAVRGGFSYWPTAGSAFLLFLSVWGMYVLFSEALLLYSAVKNVYIEKRSQIYYILFGTTIGYIGGATNYFLWFDIPVPPYGNILVTVYVVCVAYAILRHRLFDIRVIATELLIFSLWLMLFARLLLEQTVQAQLLDGSLLIVTVILGILLIRSVDREVEQRLLIEKQERALEDVNRKQEGLLHFISHEIKGYLTKSEAGFAAIKDGDFGQVPEQLKTMAAAALEDTRKGVSTIMDILDASNLKKGTVTYAKDSFDLAKTIGDIVESLRPSALEKGL